MSARVTVAACVVGLLLFAVLAWTAARSKSPTYDEPLHAVGAWLHLHHQDFRINPEDPPLWHYWAALTTRRGAIDVDLTPPPSTGPAVEPPPPGSPPIELDPTDKSTPARRFALAADDLYHEWPFVVETLYPCGRSMPLGSPDCPDADGFIQRMRAMMLVLGVVLGAVIAWWGWQLGGGMAAVAGAALFCLDPNFLAHAPLVKNDVALSLVTAALVLAVWRAGRRLTVWNLLAIALLCAAAVTMKFSGLLLGPIVAILLIVRGLDRAPWDTFWRTLRGRAEKLVAALMVLVVAAAVSYVGIWACYFFRFDPSPDPNIQLNLKQMILYAAVSELSAKHGRMPTSDEAAAWRPSLMSRAIMTMDDMRFLPQAWLNGLLYTYQSAIQRQTYLMGEYSTRGWWYYFPLAMLFKTPLSTLAAGAGALAVLATMLRRRGWRWLINWEVACLLIPPLVFLVSAMRSNLNLGLRHVLPVYPFIFTGIALAAAFAWKNWRVAARLVAGVLTLGLALETLIAFPDFIPFFNTAAGGSRGGFRLLGDSNLDWGQDLKLLSQWQQEHPGVTLYLAYFGLADPWAYGIEYINLPPGYKFGPQDQAPSAPGVLAISATHLQGIYLEGFSEADNMRQFYAHLRSTEPLEVLGGSIYLYPWPPVGPMRR